MTGWEAIGWALIFAVVIVIDGFAIGLVIIFIQSGTRSSRVSGGYKSRSHE